jgi:hypothetical protein
VVMRLECSETTFGELHPAGFLALSRFKHSLTSGLNWLKLDGV